MAHIDLTEIISDLMAVNLFGATESSIDVIECAFVLSRYAAAGSGSALLGAQDASAREGWSAASCSQWHVQQQWLPTLWGSKPFCGPLWRPVVVRHGSFATSKHIAFSGRMGGSRHCQPAYDQAAFTSLIRTATIASEAVLCMQRLSSS